MIKNKNHTFGFSLIEILATLFIISILLTISFFGFSSVIEMSKMNTTKNNLRQLSLAWQQYAYSNKNSLLPGFLDPLTQKKWKIEFPTPFHSNLILPPYPNFGESDQNIAGIWTARIAHHLGDLKLLNQHQTKKNPTDAFAKALLWAEEPTFALNGYYLGGFWFTRDNRSSHFFNNTQTLDGNKITVVAKKLSQIKKPDLLISFVPAVKTEIGSFNLLQKNLNHTYLTTPRIFNSRQVWSYETNDHKINIESNTHGIPFSMGFKKIPYVTCAGNSKTISPIDINNQKLWIPGAKEIQDIPAYDFTHYD